MAHHSSKDTLKPKLVILNETLQETSSLSWVLRLHTHTHNRARSQIRISVFCSFHVPHQHPVFLGWFMHRKKPSAKDHGVSSCQASPFYRSLILMGPGNGTNKLVSFTQTQLFSDPWKKRIGPLFWEDHFSEQPPTKRGKKGATGQVSKFATCPACIPPK